MSLDAASLLKRLGKYIRLQSGTECWLWTGSLNLPIIGWNGETFHTRRVVWALYIGPLGTSGKIKMTCGKQNCVNMEVYDPGTPISVKTFGLTRVLPMELPQNIDLDDLRLPRQTAKVKSSTKKAGRGL